MIVPLLLAASAALALPPASPGPVAGSPVAIDVGSGMLYATSEAGAQLTAITVIVSAGTAREPARKNGVAALAAQSLLLSRIDGVTLSDRVSADGGSIDVVVGPSAARFTIEALPAQEGVVAADIARAIAAPAITVDTVAAARAVVSTELAAGEKNPTTVGLDMVRGAYYAGGAGRPLLGTSESIAELGSDDVSSFIAAHYLRGNAFASATGVIDAGTSAAVHAVLAAFPAGTEAPPAIAVRAIGSDGKRIVTHRDIGVPFVMLGFAAPALGDPDFAPMLVLRAILGDITNRADVTTASPIERGFDIVYAYDVKPATFDIAINGALLDPSAGLTIVQAIAHNALTKPFSDDVVTRYKDTARGQWALEALTLDDRAWQIGAAVTEGADPATARSVIASIDRVTPADVQRVAKRYLQHSIVALVLPRDERP
jgi:zinc protease